MLLLYSWAFRSDILRSSPENTRSDIYFQNKKRIRSYPVIWWQRLSINATSAWNFLPAEICDPVLSRAAVPAILQPEVRPNPAGGCWSAEWPQHKAWFLWSRMWGRKKKKALKWGSMWLFGVLQEVWNRYLWHCWYLWATLGSPLSVFVLVLSSSHENLTVVCNTEQ